MPAQRSGSRAAIAALLPLLAWPAACSRGRSVAAAAPDGGAGPPETSDASSAPLASVRAPESPRPMAAGDGVGTAPPSTGEARRTTLARFESDELLRPHRAILRDHFGASARGPFDLQRVELAGGRTALLVSLAAETDPIVLVVDRDQLVWSKPRPVAGIVSPMKHLALAPRPDGGVAIFGWIETLQLVAARMWADDSNPFGDFQLFAPRACDALSAAYAPRLGWVIACTSQEGTRAQRLRDDATIAWGADGAPLGASSSAGPATIVFDSPSTWMVFQRVAAVGGDRLLAFRYDANAEPLWPAAFNVGALTAVPDERIEARSAGDGSVRVELPRGLAGKSRSVRSAEIASSGQLRLLAR